MGETARRRIGECRETDRMSRSKLQTGRAKNSARPGCGCCLSSLRAGFEPFVGMASFYLTGHPRSIRINSRNAACKQTRLKTGAVGLRVKSHHWRAEFFALP